MDWFREEKGMKVNKKGVGRCMCGCHGYGGGHLEICGWVAMTMTEKARGRYSIVADGDELVVSCHGDNVPCSKLYNLIYRPGIIRFTCVLCPQDVASL